MSVAAIVETSRRRISEGLAEHERQTGTSLPLVERHQLVDALTRADVYWTVITDLTGVRLAWNMHGTDLEPGDVLTADTLARLSKAVSVLSEHGLRVTAGRSARGCTYLNVGLD